jgi:hypothetical protein
MPKHEASFHTRYSIEASYKERSFVPQDDKKKLYLTKSTYLPGLRGNILRLHPAWERNIKASKKYKKKEKRLPQCYF